MLKEKIKFGLLVVLLFEIINLFYCLYAYDNLVSNPDNYFKQTLILPQHKILKE